MRVYNMRTNNVTNPLGFELDNLSLSWVVDGEGSDSKYQSAARVEIASSSDFNDILFDSGKKEDINFLGYEPTLELQPRTRYYWRVTVWGDKSDNTVSDTAWFETGKMKEEWNGKWITPSLPSDTHPIIRRPFELEKEVETARIYITGLGIYHLELNGKKVSDEFLTPGFHSYDFWLQYQTYDITDDLKEGKNALGVMLGNGWYKGRIGFFQGYENVYGDSFSLIAEVHITYKDQTTEIIATDDTWKCMEAPITFSGIYDGEIYNANMEDHLWSSPELGEEPAGSVSYCDGFSSLQGRYGLPIKVMEELKPIELIHTPAGEVVLDFGQNMTGWVRFTTSAKKDTKQKLEYGEILQDSNFYRDNLRTAKAQYTYISDGKERLVEPKFTFYGFRYVKLEGFGENPSLEDFTGCVVYSEIDEVGAIETSNPLINKLFQNAMWGQKGNFLDVPTDCPQRDERMGWTGDAQIFASTACFNMYSPAFFKKYMHDLRKEQQALEGSVPFIVPMIKPEGVKGFIMGHGSTAWADAATVIPWMTYLHYGNKSLLRSQFETMKDWVDYLYSIDESAGSSRLITKGIHLGDWLALDGKDPNEGKLGGTDQFFIASAYYYYSTTLVAKAAFALEKQEVVKKYEKLAFEIKEAIINEYVTANGKLAIDTQTGFILALYMDLVNEDQKGRVAEDLKRKLIDSDMHLQTGFVGTPYFCHALSSYDGNEYAYSLLLNEDYPSWIYAIKLGATTIWERWNSVLEDGSISSTGMNSLNHYAYGSIVDWMYQHMCGIQPNDSYPGFQRFTLEPKPDGRLTYANGEIVSSSGTIKSGWKLSKDQTITFTFTVPFNTTADVVLPDAAVDSIKVVGGTIESIKAEQRGEAVVGQLTPGEYEITYTLQKEYVKTYNLDSTLRELLVNGATRNIIEKELQYHNETQELYKGELLDIPLRDIRNIEMVRSYVSEERLAKVEEMLRDILGTLSQ
ncbi:family 78 glycoside hydrolase catalytic domain [Evansella sp. AB-P1]|uniref:alpha-L-rhamnosidase n=1 Tax=Evansella sp. AB-P1 TaxID=3037653 RepID=UPI00241EEE4B|nr:alpha-L-rhamnosidase [Evansella sp. AB-P1]MDG5788499.1 family 78 glycoside hydrolase catalytic domain [Evansella sp. AB-P1]